MTTKAQRHIPTAEKEQAETRFAQLYGALNAGQKQAVDTTEGPVMVLAGPGTGKTQTLAMRIANILKTTQLDPQNILCLTFTESGVVAMRERLVSIIGTPAYYVRIHTFHSFCNDIISQHADIFARAREWQVLTDVEAVQLMQDLIDTLPGTSPIKPFGDPYLFLRDITQAVRQLKQEDISPAGFKTTLQQIEAFTTAVAEPLAAFHGLSPKERTASSCEAFYTEVKKAGTEHSLPTSLLFVLDHLYEAYTRKHEGAEDARTAGKIRTQFKNDVKKWIDGMTRNLGKHQDIQKIYTQYQQALEKRGRYDYEDMILMVIKAWRDNQDLLAEYQEQFQYMLVDEYQDTNGAQNEIVELLGSFDANPNIFVVGDDKQSIYRFQGASLNNMLMFYERFKEYVHIISLQENYRSQATVLEASHAVITHNEESLAKYIPQIHIELTPQAGLPAQPLERHEFASEEGEDTFVAERVKALIDGGTNPSEIAVLFRYNRDGKHLLRLLRSMAVPARLESGEDVLVDVAVQQFLTLIAYIQSPERGELLAEILQYRFWSLLPLDVLKVTRLSGREHRDMLTAIADVTFLRAAQVSDTAGFERIATHIAGWRQDSVNMTLQDFLHHVLQDSGWLDYLLQSKEHLITLKKLSTVLNLAKEFNRSKPTASLQEFLDNIALLQRYGIALSAEPWQVADRAVRLMTAHKAKGLEFSHVFMIRGNDRHWGNNPEPAKISLPHGLVRYDMVVAQHNNEDERRLWYVAMTRAKQTITCTRATHSATARPTVPSIFLQEIPSALVVTHHHEQQEDEIAGGIVLQSIKPLPAVTQADVEAWLAGILSEYVMSVTHLNNYLECPRKFYVKNLLQVPAARATYQALGTAMHAALNDFCRTFNAGQGVENKEQLLQRFRYHLQREVLTDIERRDAQEVGEQDLSAYYDRYQAEMCRYTLGEYSFVSHGVHVDDLLLTGLIDKIELVNPKDDIKKDGTWKDGAAITVVDYKTGNPDRGLLKIKPGGDYHRQLVFYKLLCDESPRFPYAMVNAEIDFIRPSSKKGFIKKKIDISDAEVEDLKTTIRQVWADIKALKFLEDGVGCGECEVCVAHHALGLN